MKYIIIKNKNKINEYINKLLKYIYIYFLLVLIGVFLTR